MGGDYATGDPFGPYKAFVEKLQGDGSAGAVRSIVGLYDSLLTELNQIAPTAGRAVPAKTGKTAGLEIKALSEIERQLFLQFLISELTYLRGHRIMQGPALGHKVNHDRQICQLKQAQISKALLRVFNVQGIDDGFYSALTAERGDTIAAYIKMKLTTQEFTMMMSLDDFLNNRETAAVRRILDQVLDNYLDAGDDDDFHAHDAWIDLKQRWDGWASKHHERMAALKQLWQAMGGGKDLNSSPQAFKTIDDYYQELYKQIEEGDAMVFWSKVANPPVTSN